MINLEKWFNCWVKVIVFFFVGYKNNVFVRYFVCHIFICGTLFYEILYNFYGYKEARRLEFQFKVDFYDLYRSFVYENILNLSYLELKF